MGSGVVATGLSLRTSVVTGSVAGVLVSMYVIDLIGKLDFDLSGLRYISVFKYYGNAIESPRGGLPATRGAEQLLRVAGHRDRRHEQLVGEQVAEEAEAVLSYLQPDLVEGLPAEVKHDSGELLLVLPWRH